MILETVTPNEAAVMLGVHVDTVHKAIRESERLRAVKAGGRYLVLKEDVERYEVKANSRREK